MQLTQLEFQDKDFPVVEEIAKRLGYTQTTYSDTSDLIGLFCLRDHSADFGGCVIKTKEFGFMFIQDLADMNMFDLDEEQRNPRKQKI